MKRCFRIAAVFLAVLMTCSLTACSSGDNWKDSVLNGFNDMLQGFSQYALTNKNDLKGTKTKGEDTYTGSYSADYSDFSGTEYLFGGTCLERENGNDLTATYELKISSGSANLCWIEKEEEHIIANMTDSGTYSIVLSSGDNYIAVKGDQFSGSVKITLE